MRSIGYLLREDDLLFRRGIMFQRFVAVPYGRMQLVDITRGPLARSLGLADLKLVTAAAASGVTIPGLPEDDAERPPRPSRRSWRRAAGPGCDLHACADREPRRRRVAPAASGDPAAPRGDRVFASSGSSSRT